MNVCKRIFLSPPHMGGNEQRFVAEAFASNYIAPLGPMVDAFEREFSEYTGIPHCLALSSGTSATHLALRHLGVRAGDIVLASTLTFIGSVTPAKFEGCELRFVDSSRETWNMDQSLSHGWSASPAVFASRHLLGVHRADALQPVDPFFALDVSQCGAGVRRPAGERPAGAFDVLRRSLMRRR